MSRTSTHRPSSLNRLVFLHNPTILAVVQFAVALPVVLSPEEVMQFLGCVDGTKHRAILTTMLRRGFTHLRSGLLEN
jgi:hypothetical protein